MALEENTAKVMTGGIVSDTFSVQGGVRQGNLLSPLPLSLVLERVLRDAGV